MGESSHFSADHLNLVVRLSGLGQLLATFHEPHTSMDVMQKRMGGEEQQGNNYEQKYNLAMRKNHILKLTCSYSWNMLEETKKQRMDKNSEHCERP